MTATDPTAATDTAALAAALDEARRRTLGLVDDLDEADLLRQHSPLMSPLVWDLAHVGNYEEQWLVRAIDGQAPLDARLDDVYDAFQHPRRERPDLDLLGPAEARAYLARVRAATLAVLDSLGPDLDRHPDRLVRHGAVHSMVVQHEHQHDETMLATRQLMGERARPVPGAEAAPRAAPDPPPAGEVVVTAGTYPIGTDDPRAYDNERSRHTVELAAFAIDRAPVTNAAHLAFVADGGYERPELWNERGWAWRQEAGLEAPAGWERHPGGWSVLRFGRHLALDELLHEPVQHVCWFEADAHARWAGRRLPTEQEWEVAASWDPATGRSRRWPWGDDEPTPARANLGQRHDGPAAVGAHPTGASALGCHQLVGDVWEWTSSGFHPWPGFEAFPYREYSEVFWDGDYRVLRGGSWATHPAAIRTTFRNWDHPIRRQIFSGFRTARDA